jgi:hypothetical protein
MAVAVVVGLKVKIFTLCADSDPCLPVVLSKRHWNKKRRSRDVLLTPNAYLGAIDWKRLSVVRAV